MKGRPVDRLLAKIDQRGPDECWPWVTADGTDRYGTFWLEGEAVGAHRAAWILLVGPIPDGLHVLHRCDAPPCCNPSHLFLGTRSDNMADAFEKGRLPIPDNGGRATCPRGHAFTEANTYRRKRGTRECRACKRAGLKKWRASR